VGTPLQFFTHAPPVSNVYSFADPIVEAGLGSQFATKLSDGRTFPIPRTVLETTRSGAEKFLRDLGWKALAANTGVDAAKKDWNGSIFAQVERSRSILGNNIQRKTSTVSSVFPDKVV